VGYYKKAVPFGHPDFGKLFPCDCAAYAAQIADRTVRLGDELGALADRTFASFRTNRHLAPTRWEGKTISVAAQRQLIADGVRRAQAFAAAPRGWLYLHGSYGAGKSHLAAAVAHAVAAAGRRVHFLPVGKLLDNLTAALRDGLADRLLDDLLTCDLLILDELAPSHLAEAASDWRFGRIERLVNERLDKPTVITANVAPDDLAAPGDLRAERIADRIAGVSQRIWLPIGPSYRRLQEGVA
jgi:DNA replication protein DnaC